MGLKKSLVICSLILLILINFISADACDFATGKQIKDYATAHSVNSKSLVIMEVSGVTNAHASVFSDSSNIDDNKIYLACDFTGSRICIKGDNRILNLSSSTNAHADFPGETYHTGICFGDLNCKKLPTGVNVCDSPYIPVVSLSSSSGTNSHIGGFAAYPTKICCKHSTLCGNGIFDFDAGEQCDCGTDGICTLAELGGKTCATATQIPGNTGILACYPKGHLNPTGILDECKFDFSGCSVTETLLKWSKTTASIGNTVQMIVTGIPTTTTGTITFTIKDYDWFINPDEILNSTITTTISAEHTATASWTITQNDLEKGNENIEHLEIYFITDKTDGKSDYLKIKPNIIEEDVCKDFINDVGCNSVGVNSQIAKQSNPNSTLFTCGEIALKNGGCEYIYNCRCVWENSKCSFQSSAENLSCPIPSIGSCTIIENTTDNCDDGFLEYSWIGNWKWASGNSFGTSCTAPRNTQDYIVNESACRYDPVLSSGKRYSSTCADGSKVVPCPSQVKLPFFGIYNLMTAAVIIFVIYFILNFRIEKIKKNCTHFIREFDKKEVM